MGQALRRMDASEAITIWSVSSLYRTPPWGRADQPDFLNAVAEIRTTLEPFDLLTFCLAIERGLKRVRRERWGPRVIDIDILLYGDLAVSLDGLEIPHPRIGERAFVLIPMAEIAPDLRLHGRAIRDLIEKVDASGIEKLDRGEKWWSESSKTSGDSSSIT